MNNEINSNSDIPAFDLFAPPSQDNLQEELAKGHYQWTNKYTKLLAGAAAVMTLLSVGAWYGHHSATSAASTSGASLRSALGGSGFAGFAGGGTGTGRSGGAGATGGAGGGGFGGTRITGTIASVSGNKVTITLDDPTQASSLKSGDTARVTDTAGFGAPATGVPGATGSTAGTSATTRGTGTNSTSKSGSSKGTSTNRPSVGGGATNGGASGATGGSGGGGRGFFNNPDIQACLTKEGVTITPGTRPDRSDPKVAAAFAKCLPGFGSGGGFGGGARPSGAPTAAPSN